jgi:hypothetical protein
MGLRYGDWFLPEVLVPLEGQPFAVFSVVVFIICAFIDRRFLSRPCALFTFD